MNEINKSVNNPIHSNNINHNPIVSAYDPTLLKQWEIRRPLELKLIHKYDRTTINNTRECWYLIDSNWLNQWSRFVHTSNDDDIEPPPDRLSSKDLLDSENKPLPNLKSRIDYRGVTPMVFYIFRNLYGHDESPQLCRYQIDIYAPTVPIEKLVDIQYKAINDAEIAVQKIRSKWIKWELVEDDDDFASKDITCCCGLKREHIESIIYWMITCCSRNRNGRGDIKYSNYKVLDKKLDSDDDSDNDISYTTTADKHYGRYALFTKLMPWSS